MPTPATTQVMIMLSAHAAAPGKIANSNVSGYAAPAFQPASKGAPLQMYGLYSGSWPPRIWRPARTRSGKFWVRSSPGTTGCPSNEGRPKTTAGSATRQATATTSGQRLGESGPGSTHLVSGVGASSDRMVDNSPRHQRGGIHPSCFLDLTVA